MFGGQSYYVLVNNRDEEFEEEDIITGYTEVMKFDYEEDAEAALEQLINEEILDEADGWHVERARW